VFADDRLSAQLRAVDPRREEAVTEPLILYLIQVQRHISTLEK
jgi:hypothetical protein